MRHLFIMLMVGLLGFGLAVDHAEARRLGGGKSFGSYSRSTAQQPGATQRSASTPQRKPSAGLSRFAGPFAGLLAGGLLASLFFGGGFDGMRMFDILLIGGAIWLALSFFRRRRTANATGPSVHHGQHDSAQSAQQAQAFTSSGLQSGRLGAHPEWFDKTRFLNDAKAHYMALQRAWDNNDLSKIQEYVTPELYNLLREERANQPANNRTEIVRLFVELGNVQEYAQQAEASVIFHGVIDENGDHNEFNETWHLTRDLREGSPWYVQGIEQNPSV